MNRSTCKNRVAVAFALCGCAMALALSVLVANLFGVPLAGGGFFIVYFADCPATAPEWHFLEFSDSPEDAA